MERFKLTYISMILALAASSCGGSGKDAEEVDGTIRFVPSLSGQGSSRSLELDLEGFNSFQVSCFNPSDTLFYQAHGYINPYFGDITFTKGSTGGEFTAIGQGCYWPNTSGEIKFVAYSPSRYEMAAACGLSPTEDIFSLSNASAIDGDKVALAYTLRGIRIADDISRQVDIVAATAAGRRFHDFHNTVSLGFVHIASKVSVKAWGANPEYDLDIAGIRIGSAVMEGSYDFYSERGSVNAQPGRWILPDDPARGNMEYVYSSGDGVIGISLKGTGAHSTASSAVSLMGLGGPAMVVPAVSSAWRGKSDPENKAKGMYLSVLMRISDASGGEQLYPYSDRVDREGFNFVWLAVSSDGAVTRRVYRSADGGYYTDSDCRPGTEYDGDASMVREYGWTSVPLAADWLPGMSYVYTLDFSDGIGVVDPDDPRPGEPVFSQDVKVGLTVSPWMKEEDYEPGINVPRN